MKRKLWVMLVLALLITLLYCGTALALTEWTITGGCVLTISGTGRMSDYGDTAQRPWEADIDSITTVVVEDSVSSIGSGSFRGFKNLTHVTLPDHLTGIPSSAFQDCTSLMDFTMPANCKLILSDAFSGCSNLKYVFLSDLTLGIDSNAFSDCTSLNNISFPEGLQDIGSYAFSGCSSLTSASLPDSLTSLGEGAFSSCSLLSEINIPDTITEIKSLTFAGCSSLLGITIPAAVTSIDKTAFGGCSSIVAFTVMTGNQYYASADGVLFDKDKEYLLSYPNGRPGEYTVPDGVLGITYMAFDGSTGLTEVSIPDGIVYIDMAAFYGCTSLKKVTIPDGIDCIESSTFSGCSSLEEVHIPASVTVINSGAFLNCTGLKDVYYSDYRSEWDKIDIKGNNSCLTDAAIHCKVTEIESGTCGNGVQWVLDSDGVLTVSGTGRMNDFEGTRPWSAYYDSVKSIQIMKGVSSIGDKAFNGFTFLTEVTIPDSVTRIGDSAFYHCYKLPAVTIPASVTFIGLHAFCWCEGLAEITVLNPDVVIDRFAFYELDPAAVIYGWTGSTAETYAAENNISFQSLGAAPHTESPVFFLPEDLTGISSQAFHGIKAWGVVIPEKVTSISGNPFADSGVQVIYGYHDSAAEAFAAEYGYTFIVIDDAWMADHR